MTLNEMRNALGLDPFDNAAADRPMVLTATGYVPIEASASSPPSSPAGVTRGSMRLGRPTECPVELSNDTPLHKYSPAQPRVPAGNPDGGQWTSGSYALNDPPVISDAMPDNTWIPGAQYAGGREDDETQSRIGTQWLEATPAQQARLAVAEARWQDVISQVQRLDPNWKPTPGLYETVEGQIANLEAQAEESQNRLTELSRVGIGPGPFAEESIPARGPDRDFTEKEREEINEIGEQFGCHVCGRDDPGTDSGNWVVDHQNPSALNPVGQSQSLYPQCMYCMWRQGGWVRYLKSKR